MPSKSTEAIIDQWKLRVAYQQRSGLSIASWCHQNNIAVHTFYYWRDKLFPKTFIKHSDFEEISAQQNDEDQNQISGICLKYQEFCIHLDRQFDREVLKQCLKALKELSC